MPPNDIDRSARTVAYGTAPFRPSDSGQQVATGREKVRVSSFTPSMSDLQANEKALSTTVRMLGGVVEQQVKVNREEDQLKGRADGELGNPPRKGSRAYMMQYDSARASNDSADVVAKIAQLEANRHTFQDEGDFQTAYQLLVDKAVEGQSPVYQATLAKNVSDYMVTEAARRRAEEKTRSMEEHAVAGDYRKMQVAHSSPSYTRAQTEEMAKQAVRVTTNQLSNIKHNPESPEYFAESQRIIAASQAQLTDSLLETEDAIGLTLFSEGINAARNSVTRKFREGELKRNLEQADGIISEQTLGHIDGLLGMSLMDVMSDPTGQALQQLKDKVSDGGEYGDNIAAAVDGFVGKEAKARGINKDVLYQSVLPYLARNLNKAGSSELLAEINFKDERNQKIWNNARTNYDLTGQERDARLRQKSKEARDDLAQASQDFMRKGYANTRRLKDLIAETSDPIERNIYAGQLAQQESDLEEHQYQNAEFYSEGEQQRYEGMYSRTDATVTSFVSDYISGSSYEMLVKKYSTVGKFLSADEAIKVEQLVEQARQREDSIYHERFQLNLMADLEPLRESLTTDTELMKFDKDVETFIRATKNDAVMKALKAGETLDPQFYEEQIPKIVTQMESRQEKLRTVRDAKGRERTEVVSEGASLKEAMGRTAEPIEETAMDKQADIVKRTQEVLEDEDIDDVTRVELLQDLELERQDLKATVRAEYLAERQAAREAREAERQALFETDKEARDFEKAEAEAGRYWLPNKSVNYGDKLYKQAGKMDNEPALFAAYERWVERNKVPLRNAIVNRAKSPASARVKEIRRRYEFLKNLELQRNIRTTGGGTASTILGGATSVITE